MREPLRHFILFLFFLSVVCSLALPAFAHPGRTDSSGGHTNHSTGDYHYHHGYSAHDHYDMDGDGIVDCPYDFVDKTDHVNNNSNRSYTEENATTNKTHTFWEIISVVLESLFESIVFSIMGVYLLSFLIFLFWGGDTGCLILEILFAILFLAAFIVFINVRLS